MLAMYVSTNHRCVQTFLYVATLCFFRLWFIFFVQCLVRLRHKKTLLGLGKYPILASKYLVLLPQTHLDMCHNSLKPPSFFASNKQWLPQTQLEWSNVLSKTSGIVSVKMVVNVTNNSQRTPSFISMYTTGKVPKKWFATTKMVEI